MEVAKIINIIFRTFQFIWSVLIMALIGNTIAEAFSGNPSIINYSMFVAVFSILSLFYLIPATFTDKVRIHAIFPVILDALNTIFFFCGGIALAAALRVHSCNNQEYLRTNRITNGEDNMEKRCRESQANTAFLWFGFAAYLGSLVISCVGLTQSGTSMRRPGGIRRGPPAMSQV